MYDWNPGSKTRQCTISRSEMYDWNRKCSRFEHVRLESKFENVRSESRFENARSEANLAHEGPKWSQNRSEGGPNGPRSTQNGHQETSMNPQAGAEATKTPPGAPKASSERFWGDLGWPKGHPKRGKFGALSLSKLRRDFGAIWGSILERLGVPKRGV